MSQETSSEPRGITRRTFHKLAIALAGAPAINGVASAASEPRTGPDRHPVALRAVDTLVVDVLIDNLSDNYSSKPPHVSPEFNNVIAAGAKELSGAGLCCAELGLSVMLTVKAGAQRHKLLFDAGPEGSVLLRNSRNLGVRLDDVETIAISHGHWDHMGALPDAVREITQDRKRVPCHLNPGMFFERGARLTTGQIVPFQKVPSPEALTAAGADLVNASEERLLLDDCYYLSGEIPRVTSFEKGRPDHLSRKGPDQAWEPDPLLMDERYLTVNVRDKGLIVFSACSHAGVVNVALDAARVFPDRPLYGIFGGLHLVGETLERIIPDTVASLQKLAPKQIMPAHCSGWRALHALLNAFGESVITPSSVGNRYSF
jgi:7,8-dihydropterin-6-yl-methyl-4-(beta-D-ribofuranosyl)aminobenzene 5'-phosphate synthase